MLLCAWDIGGPILTIWSVSMTPTYNYIHSTAIIFTKKNIYIRDASLCDSCGISITSDSRGFVYAAVYWSYMFSTSSEESGSSYRHICKHSDIWYDKTHHTIHAIGIFVNIMICVWYDTAYRHICKDRDIYNYKGCIYNKGIRDSRIRGEIISRTLSKGVGRDFDKGEWAGILIKGSGPIFWYSGVGQDLHKGGRAEIFIKRGGPRFW